MTSEDTVLVMESAATRRSFLRFLRGPEKVRCLKRKTISISFANNGTKVRFTSD